MTTYSLQIDWGLVLYGLLMFLWGVIIGIITGLSIARAVNKSH